MRFDLLIKNGHVIDPLSGLDEKADVGIKDRKIVELLNPIFLPHRQIR